MAPLENETNGNLFYHKLYIENIGVFENVILTIEKGLLIRSTCDEVNAFIDSLSNEEKVVCELGFGYHENITDLCGYTVLDEKMAHTFHIAIGDNAMFDGSNRANIHMDFVGNGTIEMMG